MRTFRVAAALLFLALPFSSHAAVVTFLLSGTSYSTPGDWNNSNNTIECIGSGGNGGSGGAGGTSSGGGGGGGAYAKITNLTISGSVPYAIAAGGSTANTTFNTSSLICDYGRTGALGTAGPGGTAANSTGTTKFDGGSGASGASSAFGGGGGGAGGTSSAGSGGSTSNGGSGGTTSGGTGGSGAACGVGFQAGNPGGNGTVWQVSPARGAGGGGGGGCQCVFDIDFGVYIDGGPGGDGGAYGGGGAGGGRTSGVNCNPLNPGSGGLGAQGIITVTYEPVVISSVIAQSGMKIVSSGLLKIVGGGIKIR